MTFLSLGLLGDLQSGEAEVGWANLFFSKGRMAIMDFSASYSVEPGKKKTRTDFVQRPAE